MWIAAGLCAIPFVFLAISYGLYLRPKGKQDQATLGLVILVAALVGIVGYVFAFIGLNGNAQAQMQYFLPLAIFILLPTTLISATVSAYQLYGLREAIAVKTQT